MSRYRNIEEQFRAIAPKGQRGFPGAQPIAVGTTAPTESMSQPSQEIARLQEQFRQQVDLRAQNQTQGSSASTPSSGGAGSAFSSGLSVLSPVITGLLRLFGSGGSKDAPAPLPTYTAPPSVAISDTLRTSAVTAQQSAAAPAARSASNSAAAPQVTVHVSAMDSQSFMDRSGDIANAVREAMLNLHPINDVVANL